MNGSGADIWGTSYGLSYVHKALLGGGRITARIRSTSRGDTWVKAGLMIRETPAGNSKHATMVVSADHGMARQWQGGPDRSPSPDSRVWMAQRILNLR
ncbi:MAG: hypothetical protein JSU70_03215 [Phycisphaerales bacterium]|nr:MAG: hypothetical protein JSU70_03215 [Phycisphaerales bacterium]